MNYTWIDLGRAKARRDYDYLSPREVVSPGETAGPYRRPNKLRRHIGWRYNTKQYIYLWRNYENFDYRANDFAPGLSD